MATQDGAEPSQPMLSPEWWSGRPRHARRLYVAVYGLMMFFGQVVWDGTEALAHLAWRALT